MATSKTSALTTTTSTDARETAADSPSTHVLRSRLAELEVERADVAAEAAIPPAAGDVADRSHNVDALIRLAGLERHIESLHLQLQDARRQRVEPSDMASLGATVWLQFDGDVEDEPYLIGSVEQAELGQNVITPSSPLGKVVLGARTSAHLAYICPGRRPTGVTVTRVAH